MLQTLLSPLLTLWQRAQVLPSPYTRGCMLR
jgi:hypothetical protein